MVSIMLTQSAFAHVVFAPPKVYAKAGARPALDFAPQRTSYINLGTQSYLLALDSVKQFQSETEAFLDKPTPASLARSKNAWIAARKVYLQTEIFRFNDGPIDAPASAERPEGPERHINAWPVDESTIDAVIGDQRAGLIQQKDFDLSTESIRAHDQAQDESAITSGWHAIEFLLWGQDTAADGPGARSYKDYLPSDPIRDRRRTYLRLVTQMLVNDIASVTQAWSDSASGEFRKQLELTPAVEVLGRGLHGATSYVAIELFGERFAVALDSGSQEDEHSCFSDTTLLDLQSGLTGIRNFLNATVDGKKLGPSVLDLLDYHDPKVANRIRQHLDAADKGLANLDMRFDQLIITPSDHPSRLAAEHTLAEIRALAQSLKAASESLGVHIVVPGI